MQNQVPILPRFCLCSFAVSGIWHNILGTYSNFMIFFFIFRSQDQPTHNRWMRSRNNYLTGQYCWISMECWISGVTGATNSESILCASLEVQPWLYVLRERPSWSDANFIFTWISTNQLCQFLYNVKFPIAVVPNSFSSIKWNEYAKIDWTKIW